MNIKLGENTHDWVVENGQLQLVTGKDEIKQMIKCNLQTFFGEWYLDTTIGVPYFQQVLVKNPNAPAIEQLFIAEITNTPGVIELTEPLTLTFDKQTRELNIEFKADTVDGIIDFNEVLAA